MKLLKKLTILALFLNFASCRNNDDSNIVSQQYIHKYGFDMTESEWESRQKEGTSITVFKDGVTVTKTYNNGKLHGPTKYTFPNSSTIEKINFYDNGLLTKEIYHDKKGKPYKEEVYEANNRKVTTFWDNLGVPISIEQYENGCLINGKYYKPDNTLEASIDNASGIRIKRDSNSEMLYKDQIENGELKFRTTYHSNGKIKSTMGFNNYQLHGEQINYSPKGEKLLVMHWDNGRLNGSKIIYKNNHVISEISYKNGMKSGIERHYADDQQLKVEIHWEKDKKHGSHRIFKDNETEIKWFYKGKAVSLKKFEEFSYREKLIANKDQFFEMIEQLDSKTAMQE